MNTLFVFRYDQFGIGGIQTWIYRAVKLLLKQNMPILILTNKDRPINEGFCGAFSDNLVTIIDYKEENAKEYSRFEYIKYYVFTLEGLAQAFKLKHRLMNANMDLFYCVPNFKGTDYYYDEPFGRIMNKRINHRLSRIFTQLNEADQIRYFSRSHYDVMQSRYGYHNPNYQSVCVPLVDIIDPFDENQRRAVWKRDEFRIIAVSRFDFPHKAFIIGLIDAYEKIKQTYTNVTLHIVGYGHSLGEIENRISKLDSDVALGITIIGETNYDDLPVLYKDANLNISLAGCCSLGARNGVLSIPARHFSYTCEVYGFLPESFNMITSAEPGESVIPYIEKVINMSEEEYVEKCRKGHNAFLSSDTKSSFYDSNVSDFILPRRDIRFILMIHSMILKYIPIKQRITRALHGELLSMIRKKL